MARRSLLLALVGVLCVGVGVATGQVSAPNVKAALLRAGYAARTQCGDTAVPPPNLRGRGGAFSYRMVPTCWVVVEQDGYSVSVTPYTTSALARLAYSRTRNPWAKTKREVAIGHVLLSAYRLPVQEWAGISAVVEAAVTTQP